MLSDRARSELCERLTTGSLDLVADCGSSVEVQLFGFGLRLIPSSGAALLAWFLVPGRDELFVSVDPSELSWDVDPTAPDAADEVLALLRAGIEGRMVLRASPRAQRITATLDSGRIVESSLSRSRSRRVLRSRLPLSGREATFAPYPTDGGPARVRDVARAPALLTAISDATAPDVARAGYRMTHTFAVDGIHGLPSSRRGGAVFGWGTQVRRPDGTTALYLWLDGFDTDLAVMVDDTLWFEWRDLGDQDAVQAECVEVVRAALEGRLVRGPGRTAWVPLPDGRHVSTEPPPPTDD